MQSTQLYEFKFSESEEESSDSNIKIALGSGLIANQLQKLVEKIKTLEEQIMQNYKTITALEEARVKGEVKIKVEIFNKDRTKLEAFLSQLNIYFNYNPAKTQVNRNLKIIIFISRRVLT
jgi:flagellar biosynthesis chaperone FliJ